jgi:hypothetical protein
LCFEQTPDGLWRLGTFDLAIDALRLPADDLDDIAELLAAADAPVEVEGAGTAVGYDGWDASAWPNTAATQVSNSTEGRSSPPEPAAPSEPIEGSSAAAGGSEVVSHRAMETSATAAGGSEVVSHRATEASAVAGAELVSGTAIPAVEVGTSEAVPGAEKGLGVLPWTYLVRILGPVDVVDLDGRPVLFERAKALELVVWLAQHRTNASRLAARTALWSTDVRDSTFANVVSDARRSLGRAGAAPGGDEWLARSGAERLPLHPLVRTDVELAAAHVQRARAGIDPQRELEAALALVRGTPYCGAPYLWPDGEGLTANAVLLVVTAACELARRRLDAGDLDGVFEATAQGLSVLPGHEELVCLRMEAHAARGDLRAVGTEFDVYERLVLSDPWCDGAISEKVAATRARLLRAPAGVRAELAASAR